MSSEKPKPRRAVNTIGLRLTLWGAGVTLVVCLLLCGILYAGLSYSLHHEVDGFLEGEVDEFTAILREHGDDYKAAEVGIQRELGGRSRGDLSFRLLDGDGQALVSSTPEDKFGAIWMPPPEWDASQSKSCFHTVRIPGQPYAVRLCSQRFVGSDGRTHIAQAGYLLDRLSRSLATFRHICLIALLCAGALAILGGRVVAARSLRPLQVMNAKARQIDARKLEERIPESQTGDELDQLARTLNAMLDRIQQYVTRLRQFTADASHEFRSPLAALRGNAEVALTHNRSTEELRHVIEESVEQYDRLGRIADDLLLLAQADAGHFHLHRERIRLDQAIADVVDLYSALATERNVELTFADQLQQVVLNLLNNSLHALEEKRGGSIRITALRDGDSHISISVADDGCGIPSEHMDKIFQPFFTTRPAGHGTGLGLSTVYGIVEGFGGRITVTSEVNIGTVFTVRLPLEPPASADYANSGGD